MNKREAIRGKTITSMINSIYHSNDFLKLNVMPIKYKSVHPKEEYCDKYNQTTYFLPSFHDCS